MLRICVTLIFSVLFFSAAEQYQRNEKVSLRSENNTLIYAGLSTPVPDKVEKPATIALGAFPIVADAKKKKVVAARKSKNTSAKNIYRISDVTANNWPLVDNGLLRALEHQLKALNHSNASAVTIGDLHMTKSQLRETIALLTSCGNSKANPADLLTAHQLSGADHKGNVKFTGYFTPVVIASTHQSGAFQHSFNIVKGKKVTRCYAQTAAEIRNIRMQGSCYVELDGKERIYIAYVAQNAMNRIVDRGLGQVREVTLTSEGEVGTESAAGNGYSNQNTFVQRKENQPMGAAHVPLLEDYTIAVDTRYIPLGSVLLGIVPMSDGKGGIRYEYRFLLAQDTGGAIKGPGHVDFYTGVGTAAYNEARYMSKFGKLYLLLPKV